MNSKEKNEIIKSIIELIGEAIDLDSEDSDKEDILIGLSNLCETASYLPVKKTKKQWIKPWRNARVDHGSYSFLRNELLLTDEMSYKNYLRMSEQQFNFVLNLVQQDIRRADTQMRKAISPAEKLAITLRFLATGETFRSIDYQTIVSRSKISGVVPEVCKAICKHMAPIYLKFPKTPLEWEKIAREFAVKWQFPNCLGALDGKHISFRPLRKDGAFYHNYKVTNSIVLMALADSNCRFIFVDIGCNGRNNDAGVFLQSGLKEVLEDEKQIPANTVVGNGRMLPYVVVGDDAFPLQTHLMKPYPYHSNLREKQIFNARLSRARHVVEHAFGILSNRFRIFLAPMNLKKPETVEIIILARCVLRNFLLDLNDTLFNQSVDSPMENNENPDSMYNPKKGRAEHFRQQFMSYFNNEGKVDWL